MDYRGYQAYKEQSVNTMTKGEMLLLLYDEMSKRLSRAQLSLEHEQFEVFDQSVTRCTDIVRYLEETLNYSYPISQELKRMYDFFLYELARIQASRSASAIPQLQALVKELREAFSNASRQSGI